MIAIVDYKAGNLTSVAAAVDALGFDSRITSDPADIADAKRIIFPGVGAAGAAMHHLTDLGLIEPIRQAVADGKPFLGICLGYQVLFETSDEDGGVDCLGVLEGRVVRFPDDMHDPGDPLPLKIPQMGWNEARFLADHPVFRDVPEGSEFYFVHSYYPQPTPEDVAAKTVYGIEFASGVARDSLVAFQFHPEKSGRPGLKLLENFCRWNGR
jgi:glutamine amidotransferase